MAYNKFPKIIGDAKTKYKLDAKLKIAKDPLNK